MSRKIDDSEEILITRCHKDNGKEKFEERKSENEVYYVIKMEMAELYFPFFSFFLLFFRKKNFLNDRRMS